MHPILWSPAGTGFQTLAEFKGWNAQWIWDVSDRSSSSSPFLAVGGGLDNRNGRHALVWVIQ
jgi:hypothetical protein